MWTAPAGTTVTNQAIRRLTLSNHSSGLARRLPLTTHVNEALA